MSELKRKTTQRKQAACGELKSLATEVGVPLPHSAADLKKDDFSDLLRLVLAACATPDQHARAEKAQKTYDGTGLLPLVTDGQSSQPASAAAPGDVHDDGQAAQPGVAASPVDQPASTDSTDQRAAYRLRSKSCLTTYSSSTFVEPYITELWLMFLHFLRGLKFVFCWTATLERSLNSKDPGMLHLHAFMEFYKARAKT